MYLQARLIVLTLIGCSDSDYFPGKASKEIWLQLKANKFESINLSEFGGNEILPLCFGQFAQGEQLTFASWSIQKGGEVPLHSHMHEQIVYCLKGVFEMTLGEETHVLRSGDLLLGDIVISGV